MEAMRPPLGRHSLDRFVLATSAAALVPVVSFLGPAAASVLAGSLVVETIFGLPGMGRHLVQGALNRAAALAAL